MKRPPPAMTGAASVIALLLVAGCASSSGSGSTAATTSPAAASTPASPASTAPVSGDAAASTLAAANAFIATLGSGQRSTVVADRTPANLGQWSNLPDQLFKRAGLRMDTLSAAQKTAEMAILKAALSPAGYRQVQQITAADGVLAASGGFNLDFGADHYWIRFVGRPSSTTAWTIQFGGHHLALNVTVVGPQMTIAPTLWGAQPATYQQAGASYEPLRGETVKAFAVIDGLDATQQKAAILTTPIREIVLGAGQDGKTIAAEGARASTFTAKQKGLLLALVDEWLTTQNTENSAAKVATAKAQIDQMTFAWYGATKIGNPIYYRVQSPAFVIEFAHQQGQGPNAGGITHIHSIYREVGNDYGAGLG